MTIRFDPERHLYYATRDGVEALVPNVTLMIASHGLVDTSFFTKESRDRGTHVHQAVHYYIQNDLDKKSVRPEWRGHVDAAIRLLDDTGAKLSQVQTEVRVHDEKRNYCGTADYFGPFLGEATVLDWKSGAIGAATGIQTALYDMAFPLPNGARRRRIGVQLRADGTYKKVDLDRDLDRDGRDYHRAAWLVEMYHRFHWKRDQKEFLRAA